MERVSSLINVHWNSAKETFKIFVNSSIWSLFKLTQGNYVAIKQLLKSSVQLTRELLVELKEVSELQHQNVNSFVGACVDSPNICILTQYCNKGSLQDVLFNDDLKLDWMFQVSIASDIARVSFIIIFLHKLWFFRKHYFIIKFIS